MNKQAQQPQKIDFTLHKAQQLELLNQNVELLKNNVYGQTQVDIVLYALTLGKSEEEAVEYSLTLIDKINEVNIRKMKEKKEEIEQSMRAANPQVQEGQPSQDENRAAT